jgi:membrane AbrB-like protein
VSTAAQSREPQRESRLRSLAPLLPVGALVFALGTLLDRAGLDSAFLFAALLVGLAVALLLPGSRTAVPRPAFIAAQATLGAMLGTFLDSSSLSSLADDWLPVAVVSVGTLVLSVAAGLVLTRTTEVDAPTGTLGMVAGGASGIVAMADELGADARLVAFMQYLRVLVVVLSIPVIVALGFPAAGGGPGPDDGPLLAGASDWLLVSAVAFAGAWVGRLTRLPAATLLGPLLLAGAIALIWPDALEVPPLAREVAFALIGLEVGLRFTVETLRAMGRLLVPVVVAILALMAGSFLFALGLAATTSASLLESYLATTPGGLYAVLAVAFGAGADTTFVVAVQTLRLLSLVILAPFVVRWVVSRVAR